MRTKMLLFVVVASAGTVLTTISPTAEQILHGYVPEAMARLHVQPTGRLAGTNHLNLAIGLPLWNQAALTHLLREIYDPASANFHHFLKLKQ